MKVTVVGGSKRWPSLLTAEQAAEMTDLNVQTIRTMLATGVLRGRQMPGGAYVLSRADLIIDIASHRHKVAADYRARGDARRGIPLGPRTKQP